MMEMYLSAMHPAIWRIVQRGYTVKDTDSPATIQQNEHKNALAVNAILTVCLVGEPREWSGADPLPRLFGWGVAGAEPLPREYTLEMRVGSVPQNSRDGAAPLPFCSSVSPPSP
jgi:hypothetical protein